MEYHIAIKNHVFQDTRNVFLVLLLLLNANNMLLSEKGNTKQCESNFVKGTYIQKKNLEYIIIH